MARYDFKDILTSRSTCISVAVRASKSLALHPTSTSGS
jgi:hypothetical protein